MNRPDLDFKIRSAAFQFLEWQTRLHGEVLPRRVLAEGFVFEGSRIPLMGPPGIFKPHMLELPLSITTAPVVAGKPPPYDDAFDEGGYLRYRYRGTDPNHRDNAGLREVMHRRLPLVYFYGIVQGRYSAQWPAFVVHDDPRGLRLTVAVDDRTLARRAATSADRTPRPSRRSCRRPPSTELRPGPLILAPSRNRRQYRDRILPSLSPRPRRSA